MRVINRKLELGTLLLLLVVMASLAMACAEGVKLARESDSQPAASSEPSPSTPVSPTEVKPSSPGPAPGSGATEPPTAKAGEGEAATPDSKSGVEAAAATDSSLVEETAAPAVVTDAPAELLLEVTSFDDETVLVNASAEVTGVTNPDSVVSVGPWCRFIQHWTSSVPDCPYSGMLEGRTPSRTPDSHGG